MSKLIFMYTHEYADYKFCFYPQEIVDLMGKTSSYYNADADPVPF